MDRPTTKEIARFFDKVQITKHCWPWVNPLKNTGYGRFRFKGRMISAHRFSYELFVGPIEPGKCILHRRECGKRNCVNPNHLYMGTNADNMRDKALWGHSLSRGANKDDIITAGQRIRQLRIAKNLSQLKMARALGVSRFTITGWENDNRTPHWANLQQLVEYFGVSVKYLLYGENNEGDQKNG